MLTSAKPKILQEVSLKSNGDILDKSHGNIKKLDHVEKNTSFYTSE